MTNPTSHVWEYRGCGDLRWNAPLRRLIVTSGCWPTSHTLSWIADEGSVLIALSNKKVDNLSYRARNGIDTPCMTPANPFLELWIVESGWLLSPWWEHELCSFLRKLLLLISSPNMARWGVTLYVWYCQGMTCLDQVVFPGWFAGGPCTFPGFLDTRSGFSR